MHTTVRVSPRSRGFGRSLLLGALAGLVALLTPPAWGQGQQPFYCIQNVQTFEVPAGVTELTAVLHGAHGSYPDDGALGGFGGEVQATFPVSPGQTLYVWVGCLAQDNFAWGYGFGGSKGGGSEAGGDGGFGGGGSAVTFDPAGLQPLLVAGGGGGGGGNGTFNPAPGGQGGNGGFPAEDGGHGDGLGGQGGMINAGNFIDGGDGIGASTGSDAGGGGGGGGGYLGGGGGHGGDFPSGGGGGAGGSSFADASATDLTFTTSPLAHSGLVVLSWPAGNVADADTDGVPDAVDQCKGSDLSATVGLEACAAELPNALDVDGCTVADQVAVLAADATTPGQFVSGVARLTQQLQRQGLITANERQAFLRCAAQAEVR